MIILAATILGVCMILACQILAKRPNLMLPEPPPQFQIGCRYRTVAGKAAVITAIRGHQMQGYLVSAGFTNQPRTACQWDTSGAHRLREYNLRIEER